MNGSPHDPVLMEEAVRALDPQSDGVYVDATFGAGGYSRRILERGAGRVVAFDRDPDAVRNAFQNERLKVIEAPFDQMETALSRAGVDSVQGVVFDIGVSSMQLDHSERGFSFRLDGPLSMRMDQGRPDARDLVAEADVDGLETIFRAYGEEKQARRIARAVVRARDEAPIETTARLAAVVAAAAPAHPAERIHPATRVFQALRIAVNDELGQLARGLLAAERLLRPAGRLVVVTFHSLEDRIVKRFLADRSDAQAAPSRHAPPRDATQATFRALFRKPCEPTDVEIAANPRARSARLRAAERLEGPANSSLAFAGAPPAFDDRRWR